jgi:hypothetical protein
VKLNINGCKDGRIAGCGGIICGEGGNCLGGFAKGIGRCSVIVVELWGVAEVLKHVHQLGFRVFEVDIDLIAVRQIIDEGGSDSVLGSSVVKDILIVTVLDWSLKFLMCIGRLTNVRMPWRT